MSPGPVETDPEKLAKINADHDLLGLPYYDSIDELEKWTSGIVDALHKANTPLLLRPKEIPDSKEKAKFSNIMLIPDYNNGYCATGYEACGGAEVDGIDYICRYWQLVEVFVYFGHKRATIPPPVWTNTAHRNGVLVLGTFIMEGIDLENLITRDGDRYKLADILAQMADCYGFDGWLINLESWFFDDQKWGDKKGFNEVVAFLKQLKASLGTERKLVYYDGFNNENMDHSCQSTLNKSNEGLANAAGAFMTDYKWTKNTLPAAQELAEKHIGSHNLYFGIECWGCTGIQSFGFNNEVKFDAYGSISEESGVGSSTPGKGHGGTATGLAVNILANQGNGLGAAIFSSHWAFTHYPNHPLTMEGFMWEGIPDMTEYLTMDANKLPSKEARPDVWCDCSGSVKNHLRNDFQISPISKFAKKYPAGSASFFHTDYREPYSKGGSKKYRVHVGQQSVLPTPGERSVDIIFTPLSSSRGGNPSGTVTAHITTKCTIHITSRDAAKIGKDDKFVAKLKLHSLNIKCDRSLTVSMAYMRLGEFPDVKLQLVACVGEQVKYPINLLGQVSTKNTVAYQLPNSTEYLTALEIWVQGPAKAILNGNADFIDIFWLTVKPSGLVYPEIPIQNVHLEKQEKTNATTHIRLTWSIPKSPQVSDLPYSKITGHFSHFVISADSEELGRAYASSFVIPKHSFDGWKANKINTVKFDIVGYAFDGKQIDNCVKTLSVKEF